MEFWNKLRPFFAQRDGSAAEMRGAIDRALAGLKCHLAAFNFLCFFVSQALDVKTKR
jgi:hypothetical protein